MDDWTSRVPARMVREARYGLHSVLGQAAQDISVITDRKGRQGHPEWYREPLVRFDRARMLLDLFGWGDPTRPGDVLLDVREHGWALLKGLEVALIVGDDELAEAGRVDDERNARRESPVEGETVLRVFAFARVRHGRAGAHRPAGEPAMSRGQGSARYLSDRARVMFSLRLAEGLTFREIGERFGVGPERARQLIVRYCHATGVPLPTGRRGRRSKCARGLTG